MSCYRHRRFVPLTATLSKDRKPHGRIVQQPSTLMALIVEMFNVTSTLSWRAQLSVLMLVFQIRNGRCLQQVLRPLQEPLRLPAIQV